MKKLLFVLIFVLFLVPSTVYGESFNSYIVRDMNSKRIFMESNSNMRKLPASTTKIMTCILGIENNNLFDTVTVGDEVLTMYGSNIYLEVNEKILMQDLLYGLMLRSGNDAAMSIAKYTSGDINYFVRLMNEKTKELGLSNTVFNNPTGLDDKEKNYSSASDLSLLYSYAYKNKTFKRIVGTKKYITSSSNKDYVFINRMKLLEKYKKATGGKTGYTEKAGRVLVSSAKDNNLNVVIVSFGNTYGYEGHIKMYEDIFNNYKQYKLLDKDNLNLKDYYIKKDFIYPLTKNEYKNIDKKIVLNKKNSYIEIYLDGEIIHKEKLYKIEKNKSFMDKIKKFFKNL